MVRIFGGAKENSNGLNIAPNHLHYIKQAFHPFHLLLAAVWVAAVFSLVFKDPVNAITPPSTLGELSYQKYQTLSLADQAKIRVNVANGNLVLESHDVNLKGVGLNFAAVRFYNSLGGSSSILGPKQTLSFGKDVSITANADGSATYQGPSGFQVNFPSNGSGGYTTPSSYTDGKLTVVAGGGWKMTFNKSNEVYAFDSTGKQISDTDANGMVITYNYTSGQLTSVTDTQGKTINVSYYGGGSLEEIADTTGRSVYYNYTSGNLTNYSDISGNEWYYQYGTGNLLSQITDPNNNITKILYDTSNRVSSITLAYGTSNAATYTYTYNNGSAQTVVQDPLTHNTTYTYDASGRVTSILNAVGDTYGATWDAINNFTSSIDPSSYSTTYTYDSSNNLTKIQNPTLASGTVGASTSFAYTNALHPYLPSSRTDAQGNISSYSYNTNGNVTQSTNTGVANTTTQLQGDSDGSGGTYNCSGKTGQVCKVITAKQTTTNTYDTSGNLTQVVQSTGGTTTFTYDSSSRIKTATDGNGSKVTYSYDDYDRVTDAVYTTGGKHFYYEYDGNGNLTIVSGGSFGETDYTYDQLNRPTKVNQQQGSGSSTYKAVNYTYDKANNLKTEQGDAGTVTYSYDNADQVSGINQSATGTNYTFTFTKGRPTSISIPGGITQAINYDRDGREVSIKATKGATVLTDYSATYVKSSGADSNMMQSETNNKTAITTTYAYDSLNRLTSAVNSAGAGSHSWGYTYDNDGNMIQRVLDSATTNQTYTGEELTGKSGASGTYTVGAYDSVGNPTSYYASNNGHADTYTYTPQNQTGSITPYGSSTQSLTYLDSTQVNRASFGGTTYVNALLGLYSEKTGSISKYYLHMPSGTAQTIGQVIGTTPYYYLQDLHGSTVAMTNGSGSVINAYTYDPYGKTLTSSGTTSNSIMFQNAYFDNQSNLYKMGARYYNPNEGRFTQTDPSGKDFYYNFTGDNPVNYSDPTGYVSANDYIASLDLGCGAGLATTGVIDLVAVASGVGAPFGAAAAASSCGVGIAIAAIGNLDPTLANELSGIDNANTLYEALDGIYF